MQTLAIALSDGESEWYVDYEDLLFHSEYHPISSFVMVSDTTVSDYMPYHSVIKMDDLSVLVTEIGLQGIYMQYFDTSSSYFDFTQANPQDVHGAPPEVMQQAVDFVVSNGP